ncbi:hypothetical protein [Candidatus Odyssella acanthamoebae]|uniref:Flagellar FliJ protein n=1 Tax=Candidatus Odyssella acanthamoebae TaxID=91604 RepID=A0A077ATN0_9PROT|nr:hypothetical protein [Candidatus Paracaedibacter acanthamoebae]AIK96532.1 hypothetical protein ID47_06910 [Candidatus Paracaedibacter acanthamoebae]
MPKRIRSFEILGRLVDMDLDQLRLKLSELQNRRDSLDEKIAKLRENERLESAVAAQYPVESFTMPAFGAYMRLSLDRLQHEIKELDLQISDCLEDVRYHFQESKKMELVKNKEIMQESKKQKQQEQLFYDQIAESRHHRPK